MRGNLKGLLATVALAGFTLLAWWISEVLTPEKRNRIETHQHLPDYYIEQFSASTRDTSGSLKYLIQAEKLTHYPSNKPTEMIKPVVIQYDAEGTPVHTSADHGILSNDRKTLVMKGNIRVHRGKTTGTPDTTMEANELTILLQ